jgi:hypothetical protein
MLLKNAASKIAPTPFYSTKYGMAVLYYYCCYVCMYHICSFIQRPLLAYRYLMGWPVDFDTSPRNCGSRSDTSNRAVWGEVITMREAWGYAHSYTHIYIHTYA